MEYTKEHRSLDEQADLLLARGMVGDRNRIIATLANVNYYRLAGYWFTFQLEDGVTFQEGTTFDEVWRRYVFDRQLRLLVLDAIERIEVAVRTSLAYNHSKQHGPFGYANDACSLPDLSMPRSPKEDASQEAPHDVFMRRLRDEHDRSREQFVEHFDDKYGDKHRDLPLWEAVELMSFGSVFTLYKGADRRTRQAVATTFGVSEPVMTNWLMVINAIRNTCAHHGRLWNRHLGIRPFIPRVKRGQYREWHEPVAITNDRLFAVLTICQYCLKQVAKSSNWQTRLERLLAPPISDDIRCSMGFPRDWNRSPIWKRA